MILALWKNSCEADHVLGEKKNLGQHGSQMTDKGGVSCSPGWGTSLGDRKASQANLCAPFLSLSTLSLESHFWLNEQTCTF